MLHTTHSHAEGDEHYRIVLPLAAPVAAEQWPDSWARLNAALFCGHNDPQTKDPSRFYYWPSCPPDEPRLSEHHRGALLDPRAIPAAPSLERRNGHAPTVEGAIPAGERNGTLASLAGTMRRRGMTEREIGAALLVVNTERCDPPLDEAEVRGIAASVARYAPEEADSFLVTSSPLGDKKRIGPEPSWTPKPLSSLSDGGDQADWQWHGYAAAGFVTLLTGLWKCGKTTLLVRLLGALDGTAESFVGQVVAATRVLLVSEEAERLWAARRDELGLGDHVALISRPFLGRPDLKTWVAFISHLAEQVVSGGYALVVFDSLPNLWPVRDENAAAEVLTALMPLYALTQAGAAVLLLAHPSKADAGEGRATRGSGAIGGFVDVIVEMRRFEPEHREDTRRVLTAYSRFEETPPEVVLEFSRETGYRPIGTKAAARTRDRQDVIRELVAEGPPGVAIDYVLERWPTGEIAKPGERTLARDLDAAVASGLLRRTGQGKKKDPYRYYRPAGQPEAGQDSFLVTSGSIGWQESAMAGNGRDPARDRVNASDSDDGERGEL